MFKILIDTCVWLDLAKDYQLCSARSPYAHNKVQLSRVTLTYTVTFQPQPESFVANRLCAGPHSFSDHCFLSFLLQSAKAFSFCGWQSRHERN